MYVGFAVIRSSRLIKLWKQVESDSLELNGKLQRASMSVVQVGGHGFTTREKRVSSPTAKTGPTPAAKKRPLSSPLSALHSVSHPSKIGTSSRIPLRRIQPASHQTIQPPLPNTTSRELFPCNAVESITVEYNPGIQQEVVMPVLTEVDPDELAILLHMQEQVEISIPVVTECHDRGMKVS